MSNTHTHLENEKRHFSLLFFVVTLTVSFSVMLVLLRFCAPTIWETQIKAGWKSILFAFLGLHLLNSFAEYFFHRYVLHAPLIPGCRYFYKQHTLHHALTHIVMRAPGGRRNQTDKPISENIYPILTEEQHEASFFPWYSFLLFALVGTVIFAGIQALLPAAPIIFGGYLAIAWSLFLYETLHAIEHWPLETWQPLLESRRFGWFWKKAYGFHLRHHADMKSNESISGFFGMPIPDFVFGTWVSPKTLFTNGEAVESKEFVSPKPRLLSWLDFLAERSKRRA